MIKPGVAVSLCLVIAGCAAGHRGGRSNDAATSSEETRQIAKEAFLYGFPLVTNYATLYKQAVDTTSPDYRAPFNVLTNAPGVATAHDKFVVTPNSDTPYSFLWMDLRAEPVVITMPRLVSPRPR